jgi:hypothetical protein
LAKGINHMDIEEKTSPLGWYVRVTCAECIQGEPATMLYLVGLPEARQAEDAVKQFRSISGESYQVVAKVIANRGPQPTPGEVRELKGAI